MRTARKVRQLELGYIHDVGSKYQKVDNKGVRPRWSRRRRARATREATELKVRRLEGRRRWYWSRPFARSRRRDRLPHVCAATLSRHRKEGYRRRVGNLHRCANFKFIYLIGCRTRLQWRSRCDKRVRDRTCLHACVPCLCASRCCHTLSISFVPCNAQFFLMTLSAVCLEIAMAELVRVAQSPPRHRVRARLVSTASFSAAFCSRLSMPSAWHSSLCVRRALRRSPERLAGPRADLGQTWDKEIQDRVRLYGI